MSLNENTPESYTIMPQHCFTKYFNHRRNGLFFKKQPLVNQGFPALFIILCFAFISCQADTEEKGGKMITEELNPYGTDSMVVEQLLERSMNEYGQGGVHVDILDDYLSEAEDIALKNSNSNQLARIYNLLGKRYRNRAMYGRAMELHQRALSYATRTENLTLIARVYNQIGVDYRRVDDNPMALEMHVKALDMAEEAGDSSLMSSAINSIGNVNHNLGRHVASIEYFRRGLEMSERMDNKLGMAINHNNLGESLLKLGEVDSALSHFFTSLDYNYQINSQIGQSICFNSIGGAYIALERPYKALEYLEKALQLNENIGDLMQVAISHTKIGETWLNIGDLEKSEVHLQKSIEVASGIGSLFQIEEASKLLSELHEEKGEHAKALVYFKEASAYRDSIINEKNIHHLATQEAIFDSERQRERIEALNKKTLQQKSMLTRQRFILITALGVLAMVSFIIIMVVRQSQLRNRYKNIRHQQRLLRSQMNPHFIFNALSAIQVYILEHDIERSSHFLTDFARLMRHVLQSSNHDYISLEEETRILGYYLELQRLRFSESFEYSVHVDETLDTEHIMVPPMLTQPFIENAIEHGIRTIGTDGQIHVRFKHDNSRMIVEVDDNGVGIEASKKASEKEKGHDSMAIKITRERLEMLKRDSGGRTGLSILDKKQLNPFDRGTLVKVTLPIVDVGGGKNQKKSNRVKSMLKPEMVNT